MRQVIFTLMFVFIPMLAHSQNIGDYLIQADIGSYKKITKGGPSGDILAGAGHFSEDHQDESYGIAYHNKAVRLWVEVQVTKHERTPDVVKWLLHEVERGFRKSKDLQATYISPNPLREINGNKIFYTWGYYRWISNYVMVSIQFTDLTGTKPEPLEVVQAYLQKFPSTIPATLVLDAAHKIQWIKDEMDRRLWLCDKWFYQLQLGKVQQNTVLQEAVKHMEVFLNYREKYYGIPAMSEKQLLWGYRDKNDGTSIKTKLKEHKDWWAINKDKAITLP